MQTNTSADLTGSANSDLAQRPATGIARGAALIGGLTVLSRLLGLARTLVFSQSIGASCLGAAYVTANQVPSLIYELVLGGALTTAMVPVLARSAARAASDPAERARVGQITSAMLTWSVLILVPVTLVIVAVAGPIALLLTPANANAQCAHAEVVATTRSMLQVFAPQAVLYGLSVVLFGLLQAYRRFTAPVLAPLVSSLVLIAAYLAFVPLDKGLPLARMPASAELVLSVGTTLGIAALVLVAIVPVWRLHLRLRPVLRLPSGVARRVGGLAIVGVIELIAIDLSNLVAIALANGRGATGAIVIFNYVGQVFNTMAAVLGGAIVISAFPALCARDGPVFDQTSAGSTRAVLLASWLGTAVIAAIAVPAAHVLAKQPEPGTPANTRIRADGSCPGGHRRDHEPVAGDVRHRAPQDRSCRAGRKLPADDRGRRGTGRTRPGAPGGGRTGAGRHDRPDAGGHSSGDSHRPDPRQESRARGWPYRAGWAGRSGRRRRGWHSRQPRAARQP